MAKLANKFIGACDGGLDSVEEVDPVDMADPKIETGLTSAVATGFFASNKFYAGLDDTGCRKGFTGALAVLGFSSSFDFSLAASCLFSVVLGGPNRPDPPAPAGLSNKLIFFSSGFGFTSDAKAAGAGEGVILNGDLLEAPKIFPIGFLDSSLPVSFASSFSEPSS